MTPQEHQAEHVRLHRALDELVACYLGENMGSPSISRREAGLGSIHNPILDLMQWSHQKTMTPTSAEDRDHPRTIASFESQRQMIVLALAELALSRPGWEDAIKENILRYYDDEHFSMFEGFKRTSADRVKQTHGAL